MSKKKFFLTIAVILLLAMGVSASGCFSVAPAHDPADKIEVDYVEDGYYYFEDDNGRSYNKTIYEGDISTFPYLTSPTKWINYVQSLKYIDEGDDEIFYNITEVASRGGGDCEDLSILMARGLKYMGFNTCIFIQRTHVMVGISKEQVDNNYKYSKEKLRRSLKRVYTGINAEGYYILETTAKWNIGEYDEKMPIEYEKIYVIQ